MKTRKVTLKFVNARNEELQRWKVVKVTNSLNPVPGQHLKQREVTALIQDRQTTVEIT